MGKQAKAKHQSPLKEFGMLMAIPAAIILLASLLVYVPRLLANPSYDFIYSTCDSYRCSASYVVDQNGKLQANGINNNSFNSSAAELYYYDISEGSARKITTAEAESNMLDPNSKSPEGYKLEFDRSSGGGFLFWSDSSSSWVLKNGAAQVSIDIGDNRYYYADNVDFIGWVTQ